MAEIGGGFRPAQRHPRGRIQDVVAEMPTGLALLVQHQHARVLPTPVEHGRIAAFGLGAVDAGVAEGEQVHQAEKLLPQPQVVLAFGLRMTNCAPCRLSR